MKKWVIIGLSLFFIGLIVCVVGLANANYNFKINEVLKQEIKEYVYNETEFDSIEYDGKVADIRIKTSTTNEVVVTTKTKGNIKFELKVIDKTLNIEQDILGGFNNNICEIVIEIPSDKNIDIEINNNIGDIDINKVKSENIYISINVGSIEINNVDFNELDIRTSVGDIEIDLIDSKDNYTINNKGNGSKIIKAKANVGEVEVE
jgi:DUF4097 and DUF4098 domain-containing protein YvlB